MWSINRKPSIRIGFKKCWVWGYYAEIKEYCLVSDGFYNHGIYSKPVEY
jgi:hypothetical protein